jgi:hypothetical protein
MRRHELSLSLITLFLPLLSAWEQQLFSVDYLQVQTIIPQHRQPWSLLLSQNIETSNCIVHKAPEHAQVHRSIKEPGDVVVINKAPTSLDNLENIKEHTLEIIAYDNRALWIKTSELCASIDYQYFLEVEDFAEYEVVCTL